MVNVLFILADDLGWNDVGYHGSPIKTPSIDRLMAGGAELDRHYVCPVCTPTRASLLTGLYASRFGSHATFPTNLPVIPGGFYTMAHMFRDCGYATGLFGKWHLGSGIKHHPGNYGFDYSYGSLAGGIDPYTHFYKQGPYQHCWHRNGVLTDEIGHATDLITDEAIAWIKSQSKPWFCYLPFTAVHTPVRAKEEWLNRYAGTVFDRDPARDRSFREYAAYTSHMDDCVGRLVETLKCLNIIDNTIVVFVSDNGAAVEDAYEDTVNYPGRYEKMPRTGNNDPLRGYKAQMYEGGIRTPAIVSWPGTIAPRKIDTPMHIVDWCPTFAAMLGRDIYDGDDFDGVDVMGLLTDEPAPKTRPEAGRIFYWNMNFSSFAVRRGPWKLLVNADRASGKTELYNIDEDEREQHDRAAERPDLVAELTAAIEGCRRRDGTLVHPDTM